MRRSFSLLIFALATVPLLAVEPQTNFLIQNATIHDGSGNPGYVGSVHIMGDKIVAVGIVDVPQGATVIDGTGKIVCPGFVDLHTHCDTGLVTPEGKFNKNYVTQGCTTVVTGNCGLGTIDLPGYFKILEEGGIGTNVIHLFPHNDLRAKVMGNRDAAPTAEEQAKMEALLDRAMQEGAWGMATGLIYNPGTYAKTKEIAALAKVVGKRGGIYTSHIRDEASALLTSIEEAIAIGKQGQCPVHISHIKSHSKTAWGSSPNAIALIETARAAGQIVTADQYPYLAGSTSLKVTVIPSRYSEGTNEEYLKRFEDAELAAKMKAGIDMVLKNFDNGERIRIARYVPKPAWQGKNLVQIAAAEGKTPLDIAVEMERNGGAQIVIFGMNEDDVRLYMKRPWVATASDGWVQIPGDTMPHPRSYGTFPKKIGRYAIEDGVITLEAAIRSATGLPADIFKLPNRGYLKPGYIADVVIFDPKTFRDTATYDKPHQYAAGVEYVFVNGRAVIAKGVYDPKVLAGKVLRHESQ